MSIGTAIFASVCVIFGIPMLAVIGFGIFVLRDEKKDRK